MALLGLVVSGAVAARDVPFGVGQSVSTSIRGAKAVGVGDIDGDGDLDFVGAGDQFIQFGLVWFQNNGGAPPSFTLQNISNNRILALNVQDLAVLDIDGDQDLDIVTASQDPFGGIEVYRNGGLVPVSWTLQQIRTGGGYSALRAVDMDGDLHPDIVTCRRTTGEVFWLRNSGTLPASFQAFTISASVAGCESVAVGDIDGNGTLDVVTAGFDLDEITWHSNDGANPPNWTKNVISVDPDGVGGVEGYANGPRSVEVADLDGDLDLDIAVASENDDQIAWFENDGAPSPSFAMHTLVEDPDGSGPLPGSIDGPRKISTLDVDGNGAIDIVFVAFNDDHFGWFENSGLTPPTFTPRTFTRDPDGPITWGWAPAPGVTCPTAPGQFVAFVTGGEGSGAMDGPRDIAAGDLDGDGDLDLVTGSSLDGRIAWHENRSCEAIFPFQPPVAAGTTDGASSTFAADLDGDGDVDVVTASSVSGAVTWHENDGGLFPTFTQRAVGVGLGGAQSVHVADVDRDGHPDILVAAATAGLVAWYENSGTTPPTFTQRVVTSLAPSPRGVFGADMDGDGDTDILTATSADNAITLWDNLGGSPPMFEPRSLSRAGLAPWSVKAADVDGDGALDVVYAALGNGRIGLLVNEGDRFSEVVVAAGTDPGQDVLGTARAAIDVAVGDFDRDGRVDIASVSAHDDKVAWYANGGGDPLLFAETVISEDPDGPVRVLVNTVTPTGPTAQCPGGTAVPATVTIQNPLSGPVNGASSITAVDLDRDGDLDLAVTGVLDATVAWYQNVPVLFGSEFRYRRVSDQALGARSVTAADLNGDGRPDLLSGAYRIDTVDWYLGADDDACILFDSNGDGEIDAAELILMGRSFGLAQSPQDDDAVEVWWREADLNEDGRIDGDDLSALSATGVWGANVFTCQLTCPAGGAN